MDKRKTLYDARRGWIAQGVIKSAHDCSEGGLAVAVAELHDGWWNSIARALA